MGDSDTQTREQAALEFLRLVVAGRFDEAYGKHVDMNGKHHNVYFPAGFSALKKAMAENHVQFPDKQLTPINVIAVEDIVAVHSHLVLQQGVQEMIVVHIFRFQGNKIAEMWDCGQSVPDKCTNTDGAY